MEVLKPIKPYLEKHFTTATDRADLFVYFFELGLRLLKPQGWLGYISSSTFMKTGSGSKLRELLAKQATVQRLVDFGDIQVFEGVTTYPVIMVLQNGAPTAQHAIPFTVVDGASKVNFGTLEEQAPTYPQASLGVGSWQLEGDARAAVRRKIIGSHPTLKEVYGAPLYGIKTGLNEAFVIDQATRDRLVKEDPKAAAIIKPFVEGNELHKWHTRPQRQHLIYIPKGQLDIEDYPSIKAHLLPFKAALEKRATKQEWFELQQAQLAYKPHFEAPKISYGHFAVRPLFSVDMTAFFSNDKSYLIPAADWFLLALLNSRALWFIIQGMAPPVRGGFYECRVQYIETLPIPPTTAAQKAALAALAEQCQAAAEARYKAEQEVVRRIPDLAPSPAAAKLTKKLQAWHELDFNAFAKEVEKTFKQPIPLKERNDWQAFLAEHRAFIEARSAEIAQLEAEIDRQVYELFGLTPDEVSIVSR